MVVFLPQTPEKRHLFHVACVITLKNGDLVDDIPASTPLTSQPLFPPGSLLAVPVAADPARRVSRITLEDRVTWDKKIDFLLRLAQNFLSFGWFVSSKRIPAPLPAILKKTCASRCIFLMASLQCDWIFSGFIERLAFPVFMLQKWRRWAQQTSFTFFQTHRRTRIHGYVTLTTK